MMSKGKKFFMYAFLTIFSLLSIFPLYYMLCAATNKSIDVIAGKLIPGTYLIENYKSLIANQNLEFLQELFHTDNTLSSGMLHCRLRF